MTNTLMDCFNADAGGTPLPRTPATPLGLEEHDGRELVENESFIPIPDFDVTLSTTS